MHRKTRVPDNGDDSDIIRQVFGGREHTQIDEDTAVEIVSQLARVARLRHLHGLCVDGFSRTVVPRQNTDKRVRFNIPTPPSCLKKPLSSDSELNKTLNSGSGRARRIKSADSRSVNDHPNRLETVDVSTQVMTDPCITSSDLRSWDLNDSLVFDVTRFSDEKTDDSSSAETAELDSPSYTEPETFSPPPTVNSASSLLINEKELIYNQQRHVAVDPSEVALMQEEEDTTFKCPDIVYPANQVPLATSDQSQGSVISEESTTPRVFRTRGNTDAFGSGILPDRNTPVPADLNDLKILLGSFVGALTLASALGM